MQCDWLRLKGCTDNHLHYQDCQKKNWNCAVKRGGVYTAVIDIAPRALGDLWCVDRMLPDDPRFAKRTRERTTTASLCSYQSTLSTMDFSITRSYPGVFGMRKSLQVLQKDWIRSSRRPRQLMISLIAWMNSTNRSVSFKRNLPFMFHLIPLRSLLPTPLESRLLPSCFSSYLIISAWYRCILFLYIPGTSRDWV